VDFEGVMTASTVCFFHRLVRARSSAPQEGLVSLLERGALRCVLDLFCEEEVADQEQVRGLRTRWASCPNRHCGASEVYKVELKAGIYP
jgi:hypothetical protein